MRVLLAGAHGQVGQHAARLLAASDHEPLGMVRDAAQTTEIETLGAEPVVADLTEPGEVREAVDGCDAVVFAAGSGGNDVWGVDRDGAVNAVDAAEEAGADRFVMLSAMNADAPDESPDELGEYLRAKAEADDYLRESGLTHTVVRPGALTNEGGTGRIRTGESLAREGGDIPRVDVARTLVVSLDQPATRGVTFEELSGDTPIKAALADPLGDGAEG